MQKNRFDYCEIQTWKSIQIWHLDLEKSISLGFLSKTVDEFLNSEQKIIYAEKRVNNFLNNAEQKIILCRMLEIVFAENSEQFLWEISEQFYLIQKTDFMNAVSRFEYTVNMMYKEQILLM